MNGDNAATKAQIPTQKKASREGLALVNVHADRSDQEEAAAAAAAAASYLRSLTAMAALP
jgi:hypothetical protein